MNVVTGVLGYFLILPNREEDLLDEKHGQRDNSQQDDVQ